MNVRLFASGILSLVVGVLAILSSFSGITGFAVYDGIGRAGIWVLGLVFVIGGILLCTSGLEQKLEVKNTVLQKRSDGYYVFNTTNGKGYSLNDIKEFSNDDGLKRELRKEYLPDLLRLYANSPSNERTKYKMFIEALSPNAKNLNKRLKQFENIYKKFKDRIDSRNPERIKTAMSGDFDERMYVRFEDEKDTLWPEEESIGFLPFDEVKVNPARGPLFSVIPVKRLIEDGYFLGDLTLNSKWSKQKRQDYLRDTYGIDTGSRQRTAVFFQIEKGAKLESYNNYENIVIGNRFPLVKVKKKK